MNTFKSLNKLYDLPLFFPDATRGVVKSVDLVDVANTNTPGVLVNTFHLYRDLGKAFFSGGNGVREFMNWDGALISDSGGFQVYSLAKNQGIKDAVSDEGVTFTMDNKKTLLTPESSIAFQFQLKTDLMVVLDDFTAPKISKEQAAESVDRTIAWAKRSKDQYNQECEKLNLDDSTRPYLCGVIQGGNYLDLRIECAERLAEIGFDYFGYGGWPLGEDENLMLPIAETISKCTPKEYYLYGLGVGKPEDIVAFYKLGYTIFDCVLPTRDARHGRLYVYNADSIEEIDVNKSEFYSYLSPTKKMHLSDHSPISLACDCLLCTRYTKSYLTHLFRIKDMAYYRLATIHNLRFYSILMEKLRELRQAT